ncbi:universal stress protein [Flagellimonas nanhaiensis]|uniref:Universal stress protein n=1 Tax=Flagellimonas nanhaiensis TaxID=2292706 RepID=A0A371JLX3_9FLAO|nr:universal stress protein [Allomuricauda nanhaiensis]RDY58042.1 universal stress protein [Allomuricauda nanhaiensis]
MLQLLVPTDFSDNSYNALFYAAHLLEDEECTFHVLNVYADGGQVAKDESKEGLDSIVHRLVRDVGKNQRHTFKKTGLHSNLIDGVAQYAKENNFDLMVIGNKGHDEMKDILFGNNAMQLVREITCCPILIVPLEIDFKKVSKMAFISNYANPITSKNVEALKFITGVAKCELVPMTIEEGKEDNTASKNKADFFTAFSNGMSKEIEMPVLQNKAKTILEFVDLWSIDMLCMVYYPHHFFLEFIGKGIIKELNVKLDLPFLILPQAKN